MSNTIFNSKIWRETLDSNSNFSKLFKDEVDTLRTSFIAIRRNATVIAEKIQSSQPGLTIHDITHLDALWETATTVGGPDLDLNPLEAFVFGSAVLFHDLGMALVLWDEQIENLKHSKEFRDLAFNLFLEEFKKRPTEEELANLPKELETTVIAIRLRDLHAFKAKELPFKYFNFEGEKLYIIQQEDLRKKLGAAIGILAESHWWEIERIRTELHSAFIPAPTLFPPHWEINIIKLACLLRLADYVNIDDRRAPTLQYALTKPKGISLDHWSFQNKLNRVSHQKEKLKFTSHTAFEESDSGAWWLAYNTVKDIDKELKSVDSLLIDLSITQFEAKGIMGIETPQLFSKFLKTNNWEPANTDFKISNFASIIEKLGGVKLYGNRVDIPIRELIHNSCDALNAKRYYVPDFEGKIEVRYIEDGENVWFEIEDNGIGMSKSLLTFELLDFGNSYWKSNKVLKEHPGLASSGFIPIGKFGIGFFSIFIVAEFVQVISKSISEGSTTNVLEFNNGIYTNPVLRLGRKEERRIESGTLIRFKSKIPNIINILYKNIAETEREAVDPLAFCLRKICLSLPENLHSVFKNNNKQIIRRNDWKTISNYGLLKRIEGLGEEDDSGLKDEVLQSQSKFVSPIFAEETGEILGRATIVEPFFSNNNSKGYGIVTVGGLQVSRLYRLPGIWLGYNEVVNRGYAIPICSYKELLNWLNNQYLLISNSKEFDEQQLVKIAQLFLSFGYECKKLPIANTFEGWKTYEEISKMEHGDHVLLRFVVDGKEEGYELFPNIIYARFFYPNATNENMYYSKQSQ